MDQLHSCSLSHIGPQAGWGQDRRNQELTQIMFSETNRIHVTHDTMRHVKPVQPGCTHDPIHHLYPCVLLDVRTFNPP